MTVFESHQKCKDFIPSCISSRITFFILQATTAACNSILGTVRIFSWIGARRDLLMIKEHLVSFPSLYLKYATAPSANVDASVKICSSASVLLFNPYHRGIWIACQHCNFFFRNKNLCFKFVGISLSQSIFVIFCNIIQSQDFELSVSVPV